jgi:predicted kinase
MSADTDPASPVLIVLRGNSASGKSSVAAGIRTSFGRGVAIVGQDNLRRVVLHEHDNAGAANIELIRRVAEFALDAGFHVIVEGILYVAHYGQMLRELREGHNGTSWFYYFDVPFEETLRRHASKPQAQEYGRAEMSGWWRDKDLLPDGTEQVISTSSSLDATVQRIMCDTGLERRTPRDDDGRHSDVG